MDDLHRTSLYYAAMRGHMDIVKFLTVEKHCDPMCTGIDQNTPLHLAARGSHIDVVKFLTLEIHCNPTSINAFNATALHLAVGKRRRHLNIVQLFISDRYLGCDSSIPGQYGGTPLHYAAKHDYLHIVKYLCDD